MAWGREADLPRKALAVHVDGEVGGVEVQDGAVRVREQGLVRCRQRVRRSRRQDPHQLVERLEGDPCAAGWVHSEWALKRAEMIETTHLAVPDAPINSSYARVGSIESLLGSRH